jgi:hypothetical protein
MPPKKTPPGFVADTSAPSNFTSSVESAAGSAVVPNMGVVPGGTPITRVEPSPPFLLKAHPSRWTVMGGKVIPQLGRVAFVEGLNSISRVGGRWNVSEARAASADRGWTVIPFAHIPPAHMQPGKEPSYLWSPEGRPDVTLSIYTRCYPGSERMDCDEARYLEFCEHLVTSGLIQPPQLWVLEQLAERLHREADGLADKAREHSVYKSASEKATAARDVVDALIEERRRTVAPSLGTSVQVDL